MSDGTKKQKHQQIHSVITLQAKQMRGKSQPYETKKYI